MVYSAMKTEIAMASLSFIGVPLLCYLGYEYTTVSQNQKQYYCSKQIIAAREDGSEENLKALNHCLGLGLQELKKQKAEEPLFVPKSQTALQGHSH